MTQRSDTLSFGRIFRFWLPLAATWLMMALEGPFLAAVIARLPEPKYNLAAYGVAFSLALLVEAPIIMIMSAATALVRNRDSYLKLRNYTFSLNAAITLLMLVVLVPPIFDFLAMDLIGLPPEVYDLTYAGTALLLPWPAAIGFRRFYQGVLIRYNLTRRVAYGTVIRLMSVTLAGAAAALLLDVPGIVVGASALSVGVTAEALASRWMAHRIIRRLLSEPEESGGERLTYRSITSFYFPLALTSVIGLAAPPMTTFFVGQSRFAIESLAVLPVIGSFLFIFRSFGMAYQEVGIALIGDDLEHYHALKHFAAVVAAVTIGTLSVVAFTPLISLWFHNVSGLSPELTAFARFPAQIQLVLPGLMVFLSLQRALLVKARSTRPITAATVAEVGVIVLVLFIGIKGFDLVGAVAASLSLLLGRVVANTYLISPCLAVLRAADLRPSPSVPRT